MNKNKVLVRAKKSNNIFAQTAIEQKICALVLFALALGLISYLLAEIKFIPVTNQQFLTLSINFTYVAFIVFAFGITLRNILITIHFRYYSYLLGLASLAYCYILVFLDVNSMIEDFSNFLRHMLWGLPILILNVLWIFMIAFFEYRLRPYFAYSEFFKGAFVSSWLIIISIVIHLIDKHVLGGMPFNYLTPLNLFLLILCGLLFLASIAFMVLISRYASFTSVEQNMLKNIYSWICVLELSAMFIWLLQVVNLNINNYWFMVFLGICILVLTFFGIITFTKGIVGSSSKVYNTTYSATIFIIILLNFILGTTTNVNLNLINIIMLCSIIFVLIVHIFVEPNRSSFATFILTICITFLTFFIIASWALADILNEQLGFLSNTIPFEVNEIILIIPLALSALLFLMHVSSFFFTIQKVASQAKKMVIFKKEVRKKSLKKEKGVINDF